MWDKIDETKKAEMIKSLKAMGIEEDMIDDKVLWVAKMVGFKIMKLRLIMDEKGLDADQVEEIIENIVAKAMEKDLDEIKKWHKEHKEDHKGKEHCHKEHCC